jgi:hypothetical protein
MEQKIDLTEQFKLLEGFKMISPGRWSKQTDERTQLICHFNNNDWSPLNYLIIEKIQCNMRKDDPNKFIKFSGQINKPEDLPYLLNMIK